jgi:CHAD domain-containing protein
MMAEIDPSYQLLACQYLRKQLDTLVKEMRGVRENRDIEPVHQCRVASRRMRAAFWMFAECFDAKRVSRWQKRIRSLTKGLGAARDLDVQVAFIEGVLSRLDAQDKKHRPGVERLLLRLRQAREALQPKVVKTLDALERGDTLADMHGELAKVLFVLRARDVHCQSAFVYARAAAHLLDRQRALLANAHTLTDPENIAGHHQLRIDAKKLRYTLEICDPAYKKQLASAIKAVKKLQSLLGDIHDCDVWVEDVESFMAAERLRTIEYFGHHGPFNRLKSGLQMLVDERRAHRHETFVELVTYWSKLDAERFWGDLETMLQSYVEVSNQSDRETQDQGIYGTEEKSGDDRADQ